MSKCNKKSDKIRIRACRICLDAKSDDMVLLEEQNGWLQLFEICFGFALTSQDNPRTLCKLCAENVKTYVKFKEKCQNSHRLWQSVISDVKCVVKNVENTNQNDDINPIASSIKEEELIDMTFDNDSDFYADDEENIKVEYKYDFEILQQTNNITKVDSGEENNHEDMKIQYKNDIKNNFDDLKNSKNVDVSNKIKEKSTYTCTRCNKKNANRRSYFKHKKECKKIRRQERCHPDYAYDCGRKYNIENNASDKELQDDKSNDVKIIVQQGDGLFSCGLCNLSFNTLKDLCIHLNEHWTNIDLSCKLCDFVGVDQAAIICHRFSHDPRNMKPRWLCHICAKKKPSLLALHFHYRQVHLNKPGGYCSRCNKEFSILKHWKLHEIKNHSTPRYTCDICGKQVFFKHEIREHIIYMHTVLKKFICDICGYCSGRKHYLMLHREHVHSENEQIKCIHCNKLFKNQYTYDKHQKLINMEKTFKCELCDKAFPYSKGLQIHLKTHSSERPHCCDLCGSCYKHKSALTKHKMSHSGFLPNKCTLCTKAFATPTSLRRHSSVHTGVRSHKCTAPNCSRSFHTKTLLSNHLKLRHSTLGTI